MVDGTRCGNWLKYEVLFFHLTFYSTYLFIYSRETQIRKAYFSIQKKNYLTNYCKKKNSGGKKMVYMWFRLQR